MDTRKYSKNQESKSAKKLGGKVVSNSGATPFHKGDVVTEHFLIECKTAVTPKLSFSIKKDWLEKLAEEAFAMRKPYHALNFNFGGLEKQGEYYIINEATFKLLNKYIKEEEKENE